MKKIVRPIKTLIRQISHVKNIVCSKTRILFHRSIARKSLYSYNNIRYLRISFDILDEAVYLVLQMLLRRSSREFQFINTSDPDERTFLLKSMDKIKELPDNSCDIESDIIIKRYQRRPKQLENVCLADFVAWYNCKSEGNEQIKAKPNSPLADDYLPENNADDNLDDDLSKLEQTSEKDEYEMKGGITLIKRQKPRVIHQLYLIKAKIQKISVGDK